MLGLYRYREYFFGEVEGIFIEKIADVEKAMGKEAYLGEALGKHSEIVATIDESTVTLLSDDQDLIARLQDINIDTGYNPVAYYFEQAAEMGEDLDIMQYVPADLNRRRSNGLVEVSFRRFERFPALHEVITLVDGDDVFRAEVVTIETEQRVALCRLEPIEQSQ